MVWGKRNAALEANLLQQLTIMRKLVLFKVFTDIQKTCDALDQERPLKLVAE